MHPVCRSAPSSAPHVANHQGQHPADDRQDDCGPDRSPPEVVDGQAPMGGVSGDPRGDPQHQRVDDDVDQAQREDVERDRQDLHDRFDERVDQTEAHRDDEDDADPLQSGVAADEGEPVDDEGDHPEGESGQRGTYDKWPHEGEPTLSIALNRCGYFKPYYRNVEAFTSLLGVTTRGDTAVPPARDVPVPPTV